MQLYKSRDFGAYFSDTFSFLKKFGRHFYKNFLVVNGVFILLLMVLTYFFFKFYTEFIRATLNNPNDSTFIDSYLNDNGLAFGLLGLAFLLVAIFMGVITYSFTPIYIGLVERNSGSNFDTSEIIKAIRANFGRIVVFCLISIALFIPLLAVLFIVIVILAFTFIGIVLMPLPIAFIMLLYHTTFMEYLNSNKGFFESMGYAYNLIKTRFWASVGCVLLFYIMLQVLQTIVTMVPYIAGMASIFTNPQSFEANPQESLTTMFTVMTVVFVLSFLLSLLGNCILQMNQAIIYYSLKEEAENIGSKSIIDEIGAAQE